MKRITLILILLLPAILADGQRKIAEDDPQWRQQTVKRAFGEVSAGMRSSWSEKYLARLGDSAAPEIMNCLPTKDLTKNNVVVALSLVQMSFANPRVIKRRENTIPANTRALLDYLDNHTLDAETRSKIGAVRDELHVPVLGETH